MTARHKPRSYSDDAPEVPERPRGSNTLDPGARIPGPSATAEMRSDAAAYLTRKGYGDLLPVLGLAVEAVGDRAVACPTCGSAAGVGCVASDRGKAMQRAHVARRLAVATAGHEEAARVGLLAEVDGG